MNQDKRSGRKGGKTKQHIRVLVVDDSAFMRKIIGDIVEQHPEMELAGTARNGEEALRKREKIDPDIMTMDLEMPRLDGISSLKQLMAKNPLPVIIVSSHTFEGSEITLEALNAGAVDFVPKPTGLKSGETLEELKKTLPLKIKAAATARLDIVSHRETAKVTREKEQIPAAQKEAKQEEAKVVVAMGASTGGPRALEEVLNKLPASLPAAVMITQHMPSGFTSSFARRLDAASPFRVKEAVNGDKLYEGRVYVAPGNYHLVLDKNGRTLLDRGERVHHVRPAFDVMLESLIDSPYEVVAVVLTGMGKDGSLSTRKLKKQKSLSCVIVQDPATAVVKGMPEAVISSGSSDIIAPLSGISSEIVQWARKLKEGIKKSAREPRK